MSVKVLFVVLVLGVVALPSRARAEPGDKVKTNQSTKLYSRAGEQSTVVRKLKSGQVVKVLKKEGRWLQVRAVGMTGWVPRSKVDMPEGDDEIARNTRRRPFVDGRGTKRGFGGEGGPDDRIGADATGIGAEDDHPAKGKSGKHASDDDSGDDGSPRHKAKGDDDDGDDVKLAKGDGDADDGDGEAKAPPQPVAHVAKPTSVLNDPSKDSDESFVAQPKVALLVGETSGDWTFVQTEEGDAGYVQSSKLELDEAIGGPRRRSIDLRGRLGVTLVSQSLQSPGQAGVIPENYSASSSSITLAIGGAVIYPYSKRYWLGGEFTYDFDKAIPGISYMNQSIGFSYHSLNLRAVGGYDLQRKNGMVLYGRLGLHYDSFQVSNVADFTKNTAKLPSQTITSPTLGGALSIPRLTKTLGLKVSLDLALVGASVQQTKNLEDGTNPSARSVFLGGVLTYRWKPKMDLQGTYDLSYTSVSFGGAPPATSQRGHMGTGTRSGSDLNNALSFGIAYAF